MDYNKLIFDAIARRISDEDKEGRLSLHSLSSITTEENGTTYTITFYHKGHRKSFLSKDPYDISAITNFLLNHDTIENSEPRA